MTSFRSLPLGSLTSPPLGTRIPPSVHAVTCSLPTMHDVIGYEEKDPATIRKMETGYPRFVTHFYIRKTENHWASRFGLEGREILLTASPATAKEALKLAADPRAGIVEANGMIGLHLPESSPGVPVVRSFLQHTGGRISSRQAEQYLLDHGLIETGQTEERADSASAEKTVRTKVADLFGANPENVFLANSGMNAFYSIFRTLSTVQEKRGRTDWIQLGWLYLDTIEILRKFTNGERILFSDVLDLDRLEHFLSERGDRVAGIVTEVPTNPLIETPDLPRLRELAKRHDLPLIVDPTLASPHNIDILPLCDIATVSLTKYAANRGDVMLGATIVNPHSPWANALNESENPWRISPFSSDLERLAVQIGDYKPVVNKINENALALTDFLKNHPSVETVFAATDGRSTENYKTLQRRPDSPGGVISIELRKPLADFYDRIQLPKGPSFGMVFTLLCPFIYLAHYDLVTTEKGRRHLADCGIDPELIRISVGTEDPDAIIAAFDAAL